MRRNHSEDVELQKLKYLQGLLKKWEPRIGKTQKKDELIKYLPGERSVSEFDLGESRGKSVSIFGNGNLYTCQGNPPKSQKIPKKNNELDYPLSESADKINSQVTFHQI